MKLEAQEARKNRWRVATVVAVNMDAHTVAVEFDDLLSESAPRTFTVGDAAIQVAGHAVAIGEGLWRPPPSDPGASRGFEFNWQAYCDITSSKTVPDVCFAAPLSASTKAPQVTFRPDTLEFTADPVRVCGFFYFKWFLFYFFKLTAALSAGTFCGRICHAFGVFGH
jgi:hypothetical protein